MTNTYDYYYAVLEDVKEAIANGYDLNEWRGQRDDLEERLNEDLWIDDSVTGNASGSYTFNREEAKENVLDDIDTVREALREFCVDADTIAEKFLDEDWEYFDVTARCYVLGQAIAAALDEIEDAIERREAEEDDTEEMTA